MKCWKIVQFPKISIKIKTYKTFYEAQTASPLPNPTPHPTPPNQIKAYYVSGKNIFLRRRTEIYRHLLSKCFENAVLGLLEMVQCKCFSWHHKMFTGKFVKWERILAVLAVLREHIFFNVEWVGVGKMSELFWAKL